MPHAQLIRIALLLGVLGFGGFVYFAKRDGAVPTVVAQAAQLEWIGRALWVVAVGAAAFVYHAFQSNRSSAKAQTLAAIGWALGESTALFGGVVWLLTGVSTWYVSGLLFFVITLLVFPARRDRG